MILPLGTTQDVVCVLTFRYARYTQMVAISNGWFHCVRIHSSNPYLVSNLYEV